VSDLVTFTIKIDGKDARAELQLTEGEAGRLRQTLGLTSDEVTRHRESVGGLTRYVREQRAEQRQTNFLINDFRDALNLAGMAMNGMAMGGSKDFKQLTGAINAGLVAFNGIDAVTGLLPGPMGLVLKMAGGLATAMYTWKESTEGASEAVKEHLTLLDSLDDKYEEIRSKMPGSGRAETSRREAELVEAQKKSLEAFLGAASLGEKTQVEFQGKMVAVYAKTGETLKNLRGRYPNEYEQYNEEYKKALVEGKSLADAEAIALEAMAQKVKDLSLRIAALKAIANEGGKEVEKIVETIPSALKAQGLTFINADQEQRFKEATERMRWIAAWMSQPSARRDQLISENRLAQLEQLKTLGKEALVDAPDAVHGLTAKMQNELEGFVQFTGDIMGLFATSVQSGFEAAFSGEADGFREFLKSILLGLIDLVQGMLLAAAAGAELKGVLSWFTTLSGDFAAIATATVALQALRAMVATKFADGGLVTRPTLALIGEAGEPEIVAPRRTLMQVMRTDIIPDVMAIARLMAPQQPLPAFVGVGNDRVIREIRALRDDLKRKPMAVSVMWGENPIAFVSRNLPRAQRSIAARKKI